MAYKTLKDPTLRAKYLVSLTPSHPPAAAAAVALLSVFFADWGWSCTMVSLCSKQLQLQGVNVLDEASKTADPELLMHIMELR